MSEELESEGKSVAEAVESALKKWGLHRDQVEVQILQEASSGILGFGAKPARVKITRKHWGAHHAPEKPAPRGERRPGGGPRPAAPGRSGRPALQPKTEPRQEPRHHEPASATPAASKGSPSLEGRRSPLPEGATPQGAPPAPVDTARACSVTAEVLKELLGLMLFKEAGVSTRWDAEQERVKATVKTAESERLIGPGGQALEAMQFLMTLMVSRRMGSPVAVQVDTNDYWQKKENEILSQALKGIEAVRNTGKPHRLQPMDAPMRRLIHKSLANHPDIMTTSEGDGSWRKIVLRPKQ